MMLRFFIGRNNVFLFFRFELTALRQELPDQIVNDSEPMPVKACKIFHFSAADPIIGYYSIFRKLFNSIPKKLF